MKYLKKIYRYLILLFIASAFFFILYVIIMSNEIIINLLKDYISKINFVPISILYKNFLDEKYINTIYVLFRDIDHSIYKIIVQSIIENINNKLHCDVYNMVGHQNNPVYSLEDPLNSGICKMESSQDNSGSKFSENIQESSDSDKEDKPKLDKGKGKAKDPTPPASPSREDLEKKAQVAFDRELALELEEEERVAQLKLELYSTSNENEHVKDSTRPLDISYYVEKNEETEDTGGVVPESDSYSDYDSEKFATNTINSNDDEDTVLEKLRLQELDDKLRQEKQDRDLALDWQIEETDKLLENFQPEKHSEGDNIEEELSKTSAKRKRTLDDDDHDVWEESSKTGSNRKSGAKKR